MAKSDNTCQQELKAELARQSARAAAAEQARSALEERVRQLEVRKIERPTEHILVPVQQ